VGTRQLVDELLLLVGKVVADSFSSSMVRAGVSVGSSD
jgi:hypothetical protein